MKKEIQRALAALGILALTTSASATPCDHKDKSHCTHGRAATLARAPEAPHAVTVTTRPAVTVHGQVAGVAPRATRVTASGGSCAVAQAVAGSCSTTPAPRAPSVATVVSTPSACAVAGSAPSQVVSVTAGGGVAVAAPCAPVAGTTPAPARAPNVRGLLSRVRESAPAQAAPAAVPPSTPLAPIGAPTQAPGAPCTPAPSCETPCAPSETLGALLPSVEALEMLETAPMLAEVAFEPAELPDVDELLEGVATMEWSDVSDDVRDAIVEAQREAEVAAREAQEAAQEAWKDHQAAWAEQQQAFGEQQRAWAEQSREMQQQWTERAREAAERARAWSDEHAAEWKERAEAIQERVRERTKDLGERTRALAEKARAELQERHFAGAPLAAQSRRVEPRDRSGLEERIARLERIAGGQGGGDRSLEERVAELEKRLGERRRVNAADDDAKRQAEREVRVLRERDDRARSRDAKAKEKIEVRAAPKIELRALEGLKKLKGLEGAKGGEGGKPRVYYATPDGKLRAGRLGNDGAWTWQTDGQHEARAHGGEGGELRGEIERRMQELRSQMDELRERMQKLRTELSERPHGTR